MAEPRSGSSSAATGEDRYLSHVHQLPPSRLGLILAASEDWSALTSRIPLNVAAISPDGGWDRNADLGP